MNICIIGATGHIGGHLVPMFVREGIHVTAIARGKSSRPAGAEWADVRVINATYTPDDPAWKNTLRETIAGADVLIDLLGVDLAGCYEAARDRCRHVIACGSIWMLGRPRSIPCPPEVQAPFHGEAYARRWAVIERVLEQSRRGGPAFTAILPPTIDAS